MCPAITGRLQKTAVAADLTKWVANSGQANPKYNSLCNVEVRFYDYGYIMWTPF